MHLPNGDVVILSDKGYTKVKPETVGQFTGLTDKTVKRYSRAIFFEDSLILSEMVRGNTITTPRLCGSKIALHLVWLLIKTQNLMSSGFQREIANI